MIQTHQEKLAAAIAFLLSRNRYLLDGCKWVPTPSEGTDVKKTIANYRHELGLK